MSLPRFVGGPVAVGTGPIFQDISIFPQQYHYITTSALRMQGLGLIIGGLSAGTYNCRRNVRIIVADQYPLDGQASRRYLLQTNNLQNGMLQEGQQKR